MVHRRIFNRRVEEEVEEEDGLGGGAVFFRRRVVVFVLRWLRPAYPSAAVDRGVRPVVVVVAVVAAVVEWVAGLFALNKSVITSK